MCVCVYVFALSLVKVISISPNFSPSLLLLSRAWVTPRIARSPSQLIAFQRSAFTLTYIPGIAVADGCTRGIERRSRVLPSWPTSTITTITRKATPMRVHLYPWRHAETNASVDTFAARLRMCRCTRGTFETLTRAVAKKPLGEILRNAMSYLTASGHALHFVTLRHAR